MRRSKFNSVFVSLIVLALSGCAGISPRTDSPRICYTETGEASFYANKYQSRKTASGEIFDQSKYTAAHKMFPFGTTVKVTNTKNDKSIIVRINDRGPFVTGRIIDLSRSAFKRIGDPRIGVISVKIEVVD